MCGTLTFIDRVNISPTNPIANPDGIQQPFSQSFTPIASGTLPLTFTAVSGYIYLDAVSVSAVPEPGQWPLFADGLAGPATGAGMTARRPPRQPEPFTPR